HPFYDEYFQVFNDNPDFNEDTLHLMESYSEEDILQVASFLHEKTKEVMEDISSVIDIDFDIDLITFLGDCSFDGHGILLEGKAYVFFDLHAILPRLDFYNFDVFITHELIHSIHYHKNPSFYRQNHSSLKEKYFKLLFSEGIATYFSYLITGEDIEQAYWFNFLSNQEVNKWINNCEKLRNSLAKQIELSIEKDNFDPRLYEHLFGIEDFSKLLSSRLGYYY